MMPISVMSWSSIDIYTTILTTPHCYLAWVLGLGLSGSDESWMGASGSGSASRVCITGFVLGFGQWVFQWWSMRWCFSLRSNSVWVVLISGSGLAWALLVMGDYWGFGGGFLICSWSDVGLSFWDTQYIHTL